MDFQALIQDYLDGELTKQQHAELSAWLGESEANREAFVRASMLDTHILGQLQNADLHQFLDQVDIHAIQGAMQQSPSSESGAFVAMMDASNAQGTPEQNNRDFTLRQTLGILGREGADVAGKQLRQHAVTIGLAAAVMLALTLVFVFRGGNNEPTPELAQTPDEIVVPTQAQTVATLTATHKAQWAERALARGSQLHAGDRLTLTAGFAEITTNRGAIAILQAPATVELLNNNNALRLHTGKLVGICETDSSKGFVVRTPNMDVIDLGTRFAVHADTDQTWAGVMDGEVSIAAVDVSDGTVDESTRVSLTASQGAAVHADQLGIVQQSGFDDIGQFAQSIEDAAYVPRWTGQLRFQRDISADTDIYQLLSAERLLMFPEQRGVLLKAGTDVGMTAPGKLSSAQLVRPKTLLPEEMRVDSYLIQLNTRPSKGFGDKDGTQLVATLDFPRPIVGVLVTYKQLKSTDAVVGIPGLKYDGLKDFKGRALVEDSRGFSADYIELSQDRKTLTVAPYAIWLDQVRVLIQSPEEDETGKAARTHF